MEMRKKKDKREDSDCMGKNQEKIRCLLAAMKGGENVERSRKTGERKGDNSL